MKFEDLIKKQEVSPKGRSLAMSKAYVEGGKQFNRHQNKEDPLPFKLQGPYDDEALNDEWLDGYMDAFFVHHGIETASYTETLDVLKDH